MTEIVKIGLLYVVLLATALYATGKYKKISKFLSNSKKRYIAYMEDSSLGAGL